jgi:hypothetical protein
MRKLLLLGMILLMAGAARAQVSGAGNVGCPGITVTGMVANSGTANNTVLATVAATPCPAVLVQLDQTTTLTGGAITFNLSNDLGTNYTAVPVAQVLNQSTFVQLTNPYTLVANTNQAWLILLNGATYFQVKLTTAITGSGAVTPYVTPIGLPPGFALDVSGNLKINISAQTLAKVLVTPDSVALPANQSVNVNQVSGAAVSTAASGTQKVGITGNTGAAMDSAGQNAGSPANELLTGCQFNTAPTTITSTNMSPSQCDNKGNLLVNINAQSLAKVLVTPDSVALPANQSVNESQINGVTPLMNNGVSGTGSQRINIASDNSAIANWGLGATGSAVTTGAQYMGANGSGNLTGIISCDNSTAVNMSTATTTQIVAISGTGGRTYICAIDLVTGGADNVALISGSGSNCASNQAGLAGGTTAASGWNFAANGGIAKGSGLGMVFKTATTNNEICLVTSAAVQLSGSITWTQF